MSRYSRDMSVSRTPVESTLQFGFESETLDKPIAAAKVLWDRAILPRAGRRVTSAA